LQVYILSKMAWEN